MSHALDTLYQDLRGLSSAEEFFKHFGVAYEPAVVHVNRLHILKRFNQYLRTATGFAELDASALHTACQELLTRAYRDFVRSTPAQEKVFKVFQDMDGGHVALDQLRGSLPSRREGA